MIRQDSILELAARKDPDPGPRLSRSMSRDAGLDAGGEALLLRRQVELLQEEVTRLRLRGEDPTREEAGPGSRKKSNGEISDVIRGEQVGQVFYYDPVLISQYHNNKLRSKRDSTSSLCERCQGTHGIKNLHVFNFGSKYE